MNENTPASLDRRRLVAEVLGAGGDPLVVAGLGTPAWDLAAAGDRPENFYLWAGMGQAAPIGLGLALAQPDRRVLVITGDGEMLMGLGSLAVIAAQAPANLALLVLDNELFAETGGQSGLTATRADIAAIAKGAGIVKTRTVGEPGAAAALAAFLLEESGPVLAVAKVAPDKANPVYPSQDGAHLVARMRAAVGA